MSAWCGLRECVHAASWLSANLVIPDPQETKGDRVRQSCVWTKKPLRCGSRISVRAQQGQLTNDGTRTRLRWHVVQREEANNHNDDDDNATRTQDKKPLPGCQASTFFSFFFLDFNFFLLKSTFFLFFPSAIFFPKFSTFFWKNSTFFSPGLLDSLLSGVTCDLKFWVWALVGCQKPENFLKIMRCAARRVRVLQDQTSKSCFPQLRNPEFFSPQTTKTSSDHSQINPWHVD